MARGIWCYQRPKYGKGVFRAFNYDRGKSGLFLGDDNSSMADAHYYLAKVLYAQNVRDDLDDFLQNANCIPGINLVSWPITGIVKLAEIPALKNFLATEDGRSMMLHCKTAAELGNKDAARMLKKLRNAF